MDGQTSKTSSERYLTRLCRRSFLRLWSWPNIYRDQHWGGSALGKEVCDLLVVFGNQSGTGTPVVKGLTADQVQITRTGGTSAFPERVTVKIVGYTYEPVFDLGKLVGNPSLSLRIDVTPSTTMRYFSSIPS